MLQIGIDPNLPRLNGSSIITQELGILQQLYDAGAILDDPEKIRFSQG